MLRTYRKTVCLQFILAISCMIYLGANSPYVKLGMVSLLQGGMSLINLDTAKRPSIYSDNQEKENIQTEQKENQQQQQKRTYNAKKEIQQQQQQQHKTPRTPSPPNAKPTPANPFNAFKLKPGGPQTPGRIISAVERPDIAPDQEYFPATTFPQPPLVSQAGDDAPHVVITAAGRLGNQMCQYLCVYLLRHLFGVRVSIKGSMKINLSRSFLNITIPARPQGNKKLIKYLPLYRLLYDAAMREISSDGAVHGPLLNTSYYVYKNPCPRQLFLRHRELLQSVLVFKDEVMEQAKNNLDEALARLNMKNADQDSDRLNQMNVDQALAHLNRTQRDMTTLVTVHVRRTDYIRYIKQKFNFKSLDQLYYQRAFDFFRQRVESPVFVVVSDDLKWCQDNLAAEDVVIAGSRHPEVDLALLTLGAHTVTSYGTFSFLGALLAGGHFTHPITLNNTKYTVYDCVRSMDVHFISRDED